MSSAAPVRIVPGLPPSIPEAGHAADSANGAGGAPRPRFQAPILRTLASPPAAIGAAGVAAVADGGCRAPSSVNPLRALRELPADAIAAACPRFTAAILGTVFDGDGTAKAGHSLLLKLVVVARLEAGERLGTLARRLKLRRQLLYDWRDRFRRGGADALRGPGRPRQPTVSATGGRDLARAHQRIAALERELIERRLELVLLRQALRAQRLTDEADDPPRRRLRPRGRR